jgi:hypothetical protein
MVESKNAQISTGGLAIDDVEANRCRIAFTRDYLSA